MNKLYKHFLKKEDSPQKFLKKLEERRKYLLFLLNCKDFK